MDIDKRLVNKNNLFLAKNVFYPQILFNILISSIIKYFKTFFLVFVYQVFQFWSYKSAILICILAAFKRVLLDKISGKHFLIKVKINFMQFSEYSKGE